MGEYWIFFFLFSQRVYIHLLLHCLFSLKLNTQRHKITDWKYYFILNKTKQNSFGFFFLMCIMATHILYSTVHILIRWAGPSWCLHSGDFFRNFAVTHTHHRPLQRVITNVLTALYRCQAGLISAHTPLLWNNISQQVDCEITFYLSKEPNFLFVFFTLTVRPSPLPSPPFCLPVPLCVLETNGVRNKVKVNG